MRIAYDAAPLLNPRTGIGHYAASLLEELLVTPELSLSLYALTRNESRNMPTGPGGRRLELRHVRFPARVAVTAWELLGHPSGERLTGEADVVHGTNFWIPPVKKAAGVVTIHDLTFWLYPELCTPQVQRYRWIVPRVLKRCACVLTPSQTVQSQVAAELGFPEERIFVTPEGIRGAFRDSVFDEQLARRLSLHGDYLLFAGTQEPRKNLDRLIEAFAALGHRDLQLLIAGPPGWGSIDLPGLARKLHVADRVRFSGYLTDAELGSLMAGARAFVFPTLYEGFGLPPLEAMAAGIPVVAARTGSLPEVLGEAPFYCDPLDSGSIAAAIQTATEDESARSKAIEEGKHQTAKYTWRETARLTFGAYRWIADS